MKKTKLTWIIIIFFISAALLAAYFFYPDMVSPILEVLTAVGTLFTPFAIYEMESASEKNAEKIENSNREHIEKLQEFIDKYGNDIEAWGELHRSGKSYLDGSFTGNQLNLQSNKF